MIQTEIKTCAQSNVILKQLLRMMFVTASVIET